MIPLCFCVQCHICGNQSTPLADPERLQASHFFTQCTSKQAYTAGWRLDKKWRVIHPHQKQRGQTSSQHILQRALVSIDVIVHPSGLQGRGAPAGLINVIFDKTTLRGAAWNILVGLKLTVCGSNNKRSINFRTHVLKVSFGMLEFIIALLFVLIFRRYCAYPLAWNGIDYILFFSPAKTVIRNIMKHILGDRWKK